MTDTGTETVIINGPLKPPLFQVMEMEVVTEATRTTMEETKAMEAVKTTEGGGYGGNQNYGSSQNYAGGGSRYGGYQNYGSSQNYRGGGRWWWIQVIGTNLTESKSKFQYFPKYIK